jgi:hypothetical protein
MKEILNVHFPLGSLGQPTRRNCVILLASDRAPKIALWKTRALHEWNCSLVISNHTSNYSLHATRHENGPFSGEVAFKDVELLSRSDFFLGSSYTHEGKGVLGMTSTFSLLIAALRATGGNVHAISKPAIYLPTCGAALAGRVSSFDGVYDKSFFCGNCVKTGILLPEFCPFWNKTHLHENGGKQFFYPGDPIP